MNLMHEYLPLRISIWQRLPKVARYCQKSPRNQNSHSNSQIVQTHKTLPSFRNCKGWDLQYLPI